MKAGEAPRYLTGAEIDVLSLIATHSGNAVAGRKFTGSLRSIAGILNLAVSTVQRCIDTLLAAKLIYRVTGRGVNKYRKSQFVADGRLLRESKRALKKAEKARDFRTDADRTADDRSERERYYARRKDEIEGRIEQFRKILNADELYRNARKEYNALLPKIARAEISQAPDVARLSERSETCERAMAARMRALGISPEDLMPKILCPECQDTGERADHTFCNCWRKRR